MLRLNKKFLIALLVAFCALSLQLDAMKRNGDDLQASDTKVQATEQNYTRDWCSVPSLFNASIDCLSASLQDDTTSAKWFDKLDKKLNEVTCTVIKQKIKKAYFLENGTFFRDEPVEISHADLFDFGYISQGLKTAIDKLNDPDVQVSIQAHHDLVRCIEKFSHDEILVLFDELVESTFKMALRLVYAQKFDDNLGKLDCVDFVNNIGNWVNGFSTETTPLFSQTYLPYVLPLLEPLFEPVITLILSFHELTELPVQIGNLVDLEDLFLCYNQLTALPVQIGNLVTLQTLTVSNNLLTVEPDWIGNLSHLKWLSLGNNQLTEVSEQIGNLGNLERLNLSDNNFSEDVKGDLRQQFAHLGDNFRI